MPRKPKWFFSGEQRARDVRDIDSFLSSERERFLKRIFESPRHKSIDDRAAFSAGLFFSRLRDLLPPEKDEEYTCFMLPFLIQAFRDFASYVGAGARREAYEETIDLVDDQIRRGNLVRKPVVDLLKKKMNENEPLVARALQMSGKKVSSEREALYQEIDMQILKMRKEAKGETVQEAVEKCFPRLALSEQKKLAQAFRAQRNKGKRL